MLIVVGFELDDDAYERIAGLDLHGNDILDLMNDTAIEQNHRHHVWHFQDHVVEEFQQSMEALFADFSASKTKEILND